MTHLYPFTPMHLYPEGVRASPKAKGYGVRASYLGIPMAKRTASEGVKG